jgi:hypothetical protein
MAYGVQSLNQQSIKPVSRTQNNNQYDAFYFTDLTHVAQSTYVDGGVFNTNATNSGAVTVNPTSGLTGFGITACFGTVQLSTSTASNSNSAASVTLGLNNSSYNLLCGIRTPSSSSLVSKYEIETLIRTDSTIFSSAASLGGFIHCGFKDSLTNLLQIRGVYFEYLTNGTTNDTTFFVKVDSLSNGEERTDTGVTVSANTTYRLYLSLEAFTDSTYSIVYKIKNMTTGTNTEGTITPTANRVPTATTDIMAAIVGIGRQTNTTTTPINIWVDYMGVRIRKPIAREILLGTF